MSNTILQAMMAGVPDPVILLDEDGGVAAANPAAMGLFGDWIVGRSHVVVLRQPVLLARIDQVFRTNERAESPFIQTDQTGESRYRVTLSRLKGAEHSGVMLHFADVTHEQAALTMRSDFVANVSHELRTPLTAILGFIETLRGPAKDDAAARERFLGIMAGEAQRMNRMIRDLLSLGRVEAQERMRPQASVDVLAVVQSAVTALKPQAEAQGSLVRIVAPEADYRVAGDRDQLMQVFLNLAENALKYGGAGRPVEIRLDAVAGGATGPGVRAAVVDQGEGIDALHLPRLTERFYRVDNHRSRAIGGTGLGLAIVKHIVNRHRGRLKISSDPGQGSRFSVFLPKG